VGTTHKRESDVLSDLMAAVSDVAVIGAGQMGTGFAVHFTLQGLSPTLIDHRQSNLDEARQRIRETVAFLRERGVTDAEPEAVLDELAFTLDTAAGVADADLVLETVAENLAVKREVFEGVADAAPADTVLATNTSGIPITEIAAEFPFADRVVGCHWLFPPYLLPTVEVICGERTADETLARTVEFVEAVDRTPIVVERDVPGFVWNRVQFAVVRECMHLLDEGVASVEDINAAIRDGYARRTAAIGPFETIDLAGLDLFQRVGSDLYPELSNAETPSSRFDEYIEDGRNGVGTGAGFFDYDDPPEAVEQRRDDLLVELADALEGDDSE
jgi:3-hydroxybutyryl-CoA dehydrogenase